MLDGIAELTIPFGVLLNLFRGRCPSLWILSWHLLSVLFRKISVSKMSRGRTWSNEEVKCLINIWSDEQVSKILEKTHKNAEVFKMFSDQLTECGFNRSVEQCRIKVKKLRQQYIKVRDVLCQSGSSVEEKEKFL